MHSEATGGHRLCGLARPTPPPAMPAPVPLQLDTRRLLRLLDLSARLNSAADPARVLDSIIWTAADVLGCDAASVLLYDAEENRLRFAAATGSDPAALARIPVPLDGSIAGTIFRERRSVRTETATTETDHFSGVGEAVQFQTRSLLGVPMRIGDEVVGVLEVINKREGAFTDEDDLVLSILADQAAIAIRNLRQLDAVRAANLRLERAEEARSRFLSLASHELRTPLSVIVGMQTCSATRSQPRWTRPRPSSAPPTTWSRCWTRCARSTNSTQASARSRSAQPL